jgi:pilus assembly protein CpaB
MQTRPAPPRPPSLAPFLRDRLSVLLSGRGLPRARTTRRVLAAALMLIAIALAVHPPSQRGPTVSVVVAARDLAPGTALSPSDIRLAQAPASLVPSSVLHDSGAATGRTLAGAAGAGEPITEARLVGPRNTLITAHDPTAAAVPIRLADPAVADLLGPGCHVDVVTLDPHGTAGTVLASNATVVTVRKEDGGPGRDDGRLVLLALPADTATRVAATSLAQEVTVTLR